MLASRMSSGHLRREEAPGDNFSANSFKICLHFLDLLALFLLQENHLGDPKSGLWLAGCREGRGSPDFSSR
jgi:hypothetical protein